MPSIAASAPRGRRRLPGRVGERRRPVRGAAVAGGLQARRRRRRRRAPGRPARRARRARSPRRRAGAGRRGRRRGQPRPARVGRAEPGRGQRSARPGRPARRRSVTRGRRRRPSGRRRAPAAGPPTVASATFWWMNELANRVSASRAAVDQHLGLGARRRPCAGPGRAPGRRRRRRASLMPAPPPGRCGTGPARPGGRCGRSGRAGPCRSSACPRRRSREESMSIERQNCGPIPV